MQQKKTLESFFLVTLIILNKRFKINSQIVEKKVRFIGSCPCLYSYWPWAVREQCVLYIYICTWIPRQWLCAYSAVAQAQLRSNSGVVVKYPVDRSYEEASSSVFNEHLDTNSNPSPNLKIASATSSSTSSSPPPSGANFTLSTKRNGSGANKQDLKKSKATSLLPMQLSRLPSSQASLGVTIKNNNKKNVKNVSFGSRFTIYKSHKASKKKITRSNVKKERKATKTLAIVLGESFYYFRSLSYRIYNRVCNAITLVVCHFWGWRNLDSYIFINFRRQD